MSKKISRETTIDLDAVRTFYDPHSGFMGAMPIPAPLKKVADRLNGQKLSLREALWKIQAVTEGKLSIVTKDINYIVLELKTHRGLKHGFRVICFK